jgi:hypothetical protein
MVLNNRDLNQVTWEQRVMEGDPKFVPSQEVPAFPYVAYADLNDFHDTDAGHEPPRAGHRIQEQDAKCYAV